jgi:hypothetical protein
VISLGRCGRVETPEHNRGALWLGRYLAPDAYDRSPPFQDWTGDVPYAWWENNHLADCTIAALAKIIEQRCRLIGEKCRLTVDDVRTAYSKATGWDPRDPSSDRGGQMRDALKVAMTNGIGPYKIDAYARVNVRDPIELRAALYAFGSVYVGADLPRRITEQRDGWFIPSSTDARDRARSYGGHAFPIFGAEYGILHAVPWISRVLFDNRWSNAYVDEGYVLLDRLWVTQQRVAPNGFDFERLSRDLKAIGGVDLVNPFF